jgi:hypothetical protein
MVTTERSSRARSRATSLMLVGLLALVTTFAMHHEGYLPLVTPLLGLAAVAGVAAIAWLAATERSSRLASLLFSIFVVEYIKESIGIRSGLWTYHGNPGQYLFGVWLWVIAGSAVYALAKKVTVPLLERARLSPPRWMNAVIVITVAAIIPIALGGYRHDTGIAFVVFYATLVSVGVVASLRMSFSTLIGLIVTSWVVANPSEYVGSMGSGIWTFPRDPSYPPLFLLFGCWPLETIAQVSLSTLLAAESFDMSPAGSEKRELPWST